MKYYSGVATDHKEFELAGPMTPRENSRLSLDLGKVEVMAKVTLNGMDCGIAWKPPYRVDVSAAVKPGRNRLEIEVVNIWVNRIIGDEQLPRDAKRKDWETLLEWPEWFSEGRPSPTKRYTFTSARHYDAKSPLMASGFLGPVRLLSHR